MMYVCFALFFFMALLISTGDAIPMGNEAKDTGLTPEVTAAMTAVFGTVPGDTPAAPTSGVEASDDGSVDVEIPVVPATTKADPGNQGNVVQFARIKDRLERQRSEAEGLVQQAQQRYDAAEARERTIAQREEAIRTREELASILDSGDPAEYFARTKKDPREFLERLARSGEPSAKQSSELTDLAKTVKRLELELKSERDATAQRLKNETDAQMHARHAHQRADADQKFVSLIAPETHPNLTNEYSPAAVTTFARSVLSEAVGTDARGNAVSRAEAFKLRYGAYPDDATVAAYLETRVAERKAANAGGGGWRKPTAGPSTLPKTRGQSQPQRPERSRALETDGRAHPAILSQEEIDRQSIAILEAAMKNKKKDE